MPACCDFISFQYPSELFGTPHKVIPTTQCHNMMFYRDSYIYDEVKVACFSLGCADIKGRMPFRIGASRLGNNVRYVVF